jgi:hypothetical protein
VEVLAMPVLGADAVGFGRDQDRATEGAVHEILDLTASIDEGSLKRNKGFAREGRS